MEDPTFSEAVLASLSIKIQANLKASAPAHVKERGKVGKASRRKSSAKSSKEKPGRSTLNVEEPVIRKDGNGRAKAINLSPKASTRLKNVQGDERNLEQARGKKRQRDETVKKAKVANTAFVTPEHLKNLRQQVLELGGTEEDFDIVENGDSDSEVQGSAGALDQTLDEELQNMAEELGIANLVNTDLSESENELQVEDTKLLKNPNEIILKPRQVPSEHKGDPRLTIEPIAEWHKAQLPNLGNVAEDPTQLDSGGVQRLYVYAQELLKKENEIYASKNKNTSSAHQFYSVIMASGTLSDKISALTLSIQESPLHTMRALENLVGLAKKRSRAQAIEVLTALKDLLGPGSLLPSDRHLYHFTAQPGLRAISDKALRKWRVENSLPNPLQETHLLFWAYEDWLKSTYFDILKVIETWCNDEIVFARTKAVDIVYELLRDKPEQEANLLRMLVNKLGDTEKKIASRASYNILQLQIPHRLMKPHIIAAIEADVLFRPGQSLHAKYYAVLTLNQTVLSGKEQAIAKQILQLHFNFFLTLLAKPEIEKKEIKIVLVNKKGERQGGGGQPGKMALNKSKRDRKGPSVEDEMREKIMSAVLTGINRALPFTDTHDKFFEQHMDNLFRITHSFNFNTSVQALMLLQQLCGSHQAVSDRFFRTLYESLLDPRLLTSSKHILYLDMLYRSLKSDLDVKRVKAFAKRLLQVACMHQPPFACGIIYLLWELEKTFPSLSTFIDQAEENYEDEEEAYHDVPEHGVDLEQSSQNFQPMTAIASYDGRKRAPEFSNADKSCLWELDIFTRHYHPAVRKFASRLISHEPMPAKPDLETLSRSHFLNSFVHQNPKKDAAHFRGTSLMQPLAARSDSKNFFSNSLVSSQSIPVLSKAFTKLPDDEVDASSMFLHTFYKLKAQGRQVGQKKRNKRSKASASDGEEDLDGDEEKEDEIWQALVDSHPELEGPDSDMDLEMESFSDFVVTDDESSTLAKEDSGLSTAGSSDEDGGVIFNFGDDEDDTAFEEETEVKSGKVRRDVLGKHKQQKGNRKLLKNLPTFASVEDYAELLGGEEEHL